MQLCILHRRSSARLFGKSFFQESTVFGNSDLDLSQFYDKYNDMVAQHKNSNVLKKLKLKPNSAIVNTTKTKSEIKLHTQNYN